MEFLSKIMRPLQNRAEPDSEIDINGSIDDVEEDSGWNSSLQFDKYIENKIKDRPNLVKNLFREANAKLPLSNVIFNYGIQFEINTNHAGWTHKGRCPFKDHNDSDPSFNYNSVDQVFNCFGCNRGGSTCHFLAHLQKRNPLEVAKEIITNYGSKPFEDIVSEIDNRKTEEADRLSLEFSKFIRQFLHQHQNSFRSLEYVEKLTWIYDTYVRVNFITGSINFDELQAIIQKIKSRLESYE